MSAHYFNDDDDDDHDPSDPTGVASDWFYRLGLDEPATCASRLARALVDEPFEVIGFTSTAVMCLGAGFSELVDWLADYEPSLRTALPAVAAALPWPAVTSDDDNRSQRGVVELPKWLQQIDQIECSGVMRRFDRADRSCSSYLIEVRLAEGHVATGRLSLHHGEVTNISNFWTTGLSLRDAARFYRKRYTMHSTRPYRLVKNETACRRILEALIGSLASCDFDESFRAPIPWPQNMPVLNLMLRAALAPADSLRSDGRPES